MKCENHACSILAATFLLGKGQTGLIQEHKDRRIDAQYHMRLGKEEDVKNMLAEAKMFVAVFSRIVEDTSEEDIAAYRKQLGLMEKG